MQHWQFLVALLLSYFRCVTQKSTSYRLLEPFTNNYLPDQLSMDMHVTRLTRWESWVRYARHEMKGLHWSTQLFHPARQEPEMTFNMDYERTIHDISCFLCGARIEEPLSDDDELEWIDDSWEIERPEWMCHFRACRFIGCQGALELR